MTNTTPPVAPTVTITSPAETSSTAAQTITGTVTTDAVVAGQTVTLTDNGTVLGTGTVQSNGTFSINVTLPNGGANSIVASVTDSLGLTGSSAALVDTLPVAPTITGTRAGQTTTSRAPINPFTGVTIGDGNWAALDTLTITLSGAGGTLSGTGLSGSGTTYTLTGNAATITSELDALVFTPVAGTPNTNATTSFKLSDGSSGYGVTPSYVTTPTAVASFNSTATNGADPLAGLITDAAGDLFGTTQSGGANNDGVVFEVVRNGTSYNSTPVAIASFNGTIGTTPTGNLIMDSAGNLFGTTQYGGANNVGTIFEIAKTGASYSSTPTTLVSFNSSNGSNPLGDLIMDAAGNLFGTTLTDSTNGGTVFEIVKSGGSYSSAPTTIATFNGSNGRYPRNGLIMDAAGNLFGMTSSGGASNNGVVFEIAKSGSGYNNTPTVLASFSDPGGDQPYGTLTLDAQGDLFGTTYYGGTNSKGQVFELAKSGGTYSNKPTVLMSFNGTNGQYPMAAPVMDGAGDLFGTTWGGGAYGYGTVYEIAMTSHGYSSTPTVLMNFNNSGAYGNRPEGNLYLDAAGDLLGRRGPAALLTQAPCSKLRLSLHRHRSPSTPPRP